METQNQNTRILIVDDTLQNIQVLETILSTEAYQVNVARNGVQALAMVERVRPDLILLDVMMPEMDGFEACRRLKASPDTRDIPIVFLTAKVETDEVVKGFELGAVDYVTKPFNTTELLVRVHTHISRYLLQVHLAEELDRSKKLQEKIQSLQREQEGFLRHELNNRLTMIMGYTELFALTDSEGLSETQKKSLAIIRDTSQDMAAFIRSLKQLQEFDSDQFTLSITECDIDILLKQTIHDFEATIGDKASIVYNSDVEHAVIQVDRTLIQGVYQNLIKNGIEHVTDIEDESQRVISVTLSEENGAIITDIRNGGAPIPEERLNTFFEKFNTNKAGGTGLGTSYAALVTRAHGGEISVDSNETIGTIVTVKLPQL